MDYRLSEEALQALEEIYLYGLQQYGEWQADLYQRQFEDSFQLLADFPYAGASCDEFGEGVRKFKSNKHYVFYQIYEDHVYIGQLLHTASDINTHFLDEF
jgi:toxin ParE1/3/4